jgi:hypothetical protein
MEKIEGVHCLFALAALTQFAILVATPIRPFWMASQLAFVSAGRILASGTCLQHAAVLSNLVEGFAMEVRDGRNE